MESPPQGSDFIGFLKSLTEPYGEPLFLLPTQDELVAEISSRRDELTDFRFRLPPDDVVQLFLDKTRFYHWAEDHDLPLPRSHVVESQSELRAILADMPYPLIMKPLYRTPEWNASSPVQKVIPFDGPGDVDRLSFDPFSVASHYIVSEWIPGPDGAVHYCLAYCDAPGRMDAYYTGRKLLQYPRLTGSTAICTGTENGEVRELAEEVFRRADFVGLGSLEVKYDSEGRPRITEPTVGRPNLQSYSAVIGGCNLHGMAFRDAMGLPHRELCGRKRKSFWIEEGGLRELMLAGHDDPVDWRDIGTELRTSRSFGGAFSAFRDPVPLLILLWETLSRGLRYIFRRRERAATSEPENAG